MSFVIVFVLFLARKAFRGRSIWWSSCDSFPAGTAFGAVELSVAGTGCGENKGSRPGNFKISIKLAGGGSKKPVNFGRMSGHAWIVCQWEMMLQLFSKFVLDFGDAFLRAHFLVRLKGFVCCPRAL